MLFPVIKIVDALERRDYKYVVTNNPGALAYIGPEGQNPRPVVTIPYNRGDDIPEDVLDTILSGTGVNVSEFKKEL